MIKRLWWFIIWFIVREWHKRHSLYVYVGCLGDKLKRSTKATKNKIAIVRKRTKRLARRTSHEQRTAIRQMKRNKTNKFDSLDMRACEMSSKCENAMHAAKACWDVSICPNTFALYRTEAYILIRMYNCVKITAPCTCIRSTNAQTQFSTTNEIFIFNLFCVSTETLSVSCFASIIHFSNSTNWS